MGHTAALLLVPFLIISLCVAVRVEKNVNNYSELKSYLESGTVTNPRTDEENVLAIIIKNDITLEDTITIKNTARFSSIDIYTSAGDKVRKLTINKKLHRHFIVDGGDRVRFQNLIFDGSGIGGGIQFKENLRYNLQLNTFQNCYAEDGGGVYIHKDALLMEGAAWTKYNTFTNCSAKNRGGGMYVGSYMDSIGFNANHFKNCTAGGSGGGLFVGEGISGHEFNDNTFTNCEAKGNGGGFSANSISNDVARTKFTNCSADNGGGMYVPSVYSGIFSENTFTNCFALSNGGGMRVDTMGNAGYGEKKILLNTFTNCKAEDNGGGMYFEKMVVSDTFSQNTFTNCSAKNGGGGLFLGKIFNCEIVNGNTFTKCSAENGGGGGIDVRGTTTPKRDYGSFNAKSFSNNRFAHCTATGTAKKKGYSVIFTSEPKTNEIKSSVNNSITNCSYPIVNSKNLQVFKNDIPCKKHTVGKSCNLNNGCQWKKIRTKTWRCTEKLTSSSPTSAPTTSSPPTPSPTSAPTTSSPPTPSHTTSGNPRAACKTLKGKKGKKTCNRRGDCKWKKKKNKCIKKQAQKKKNKKTRNA